MFLVGFHGLRNRAGSPAQPPGWLLCHLHSLQPCVTPGTPWLPSESPVGLGVLSRLWASCRHTGLGRGQGQQRGAGAAVGGRGSSGGQDVPGFGTWCPTSPTQHRGWVWISAHSHWEGDGVFEREQERGKEIMFSQCSYLEQSLNKDWDEPGWKGGLPGIW